MTGEFPTQRADNAENVSIWWRHHVSLVYQRRTGTVMFLYHVLRILAIDKLKFELNYTFYEFSWFFVPVHLTHWGRVTHICVSKLTIIGSDNRLSPGRRQAIIWTNIGILLIRTLGTNFSETWSEIHAFSFKKMHLEKSSAKCRPFWFGLIK